MSIEGPSWGALYEIAAAQEGLFTTGQAAEAGYSLPLLAHHIKRGRIIRMSRGVYRLVYFPQGDLEDHVLAWLWSAQAGVFSHQSALALYELSDVLPVALEMTLPSAWRKRRLRVPDGVRLRYGDLPDDAIAWHGPVPITSPTRTLNDCAVFGVSPETLQVACQQALDRGLVVRKDLNQVAVALAPYGGILA